MRVASFFLVFLAAGGAVAGTELCVRNYVGEDPNTPCVRFPQAYQFVVPVAGEAKICARVYPPLNCDMTPEYEWVANARGGTFCTLNYHQPPVARLCDDAPEYYAWARGVENE